MFRFVDKQLRGEMTGLEQVVRGRRAAAAAPISVESPVYHDYLTMKFRTHAEAASYTKALEGTVFDKLGRPVQVIHKGAKAAMPLDVQRRGRGLATAYEAAKLSLGEGEKLHQSHSGKGLPGRTVFVAINAAENRARELASVGWKDDGAQVVIHDWECLDSSLSAGSRKAFDALLA